MSELDSKVTSNVKEEALSRSERLMHDQSFSDRTPRMIKIEDGKIIN